MFYLKRIHKLTINLNLTNKLNKINFKRSYSYFQPFKPKKNDQTSNSTKKTVLDADKQTLNTTSKRPIDVYKSKLNIPSSAYLIYIERNERFFSFAFPLSIFTGAVTAAIVAAVLATDNMNPRIFSEKFQIAEASILNNFYIGIGLIFAWCALQILVGIFMNRATVLRIFYNPTADNYYMVSPSLILPKPRSETFTRNDVVYRFANGSKKTLAPRKLGNFYVNNRLKIIQPNYFINEKEFDNMVSEKIGKFLLQDYKRQKKLFQK